MKNKTVLIIGTVAAAAGVAWWLYKRNQSQQITIETTTTEPAKPLIVATQVDPSQIHSQGPSPEPENIDKIKTILKKAGLGDAYALS